MVMWLIYIDQLYTLYKSYGSRNSVGVIWGQKVIFTKNAISPSDYMVLASVWGLWQTGDSKNMMLMLT